MSKHKKRKHLNFQPQNIQDHVSKAEDSYISDNPSVHKKIGGFYLSTEKKIIIGVIIFTFFLLGSSVYVLGSGEKAEAVTATQNAKAEIPVQQFDWGTIDYNGPKATKVFNIKNDGTEPLKLTKIKTSCHCTTAQLSINNNKSPLFGMNESSPWVGTVEPGKEAQLEVIFDQTFHGPSGIGPVERYVNVETNDASQPKIQFALKGNVIKS